MRSCLLILAAASAPESAATSPSLLSRARALSSSGDPLSSLPLFIAAVAALRDASSSSTVSASTGARAPSPTSAAELAPLLEELAETQSTLRRHADAAVSRRAALAARLDSGGASVADVVLGHAAIAKELQSARDYAGARASLDAARAALARGGGGKKGADNKGDAAVASILLHMDASLRDCAGDARGALEAFEAGLQARATGLAGADEAILYADYTRAAAAAARASGNKTASRELRKRGRAMADALVARGPWERTDQLARTHRRGLLGAPWHAVRGVGARWPALSEPTADALEAAAPALLVEYDALKAGGALLEENECIHVPRNGSGGGTWHWFATNGFWTPRDAAGCALATPAACALIARLAATVPALRVVRAGYSAIDGRVALRPHCGWTNAQLKMHVGLRVPVDGDGQPCARLTVGNETRAWEAGRVLFFDDSFRHSVAHSCDAERVVFQLVFEHPDVGGGGGRAAEKADADAGVFY